jgi:hypothetical protein
MSSDLSANELKPRELRLDRLVGRQVLALNHRPAGRLHEFRAEMRGQACVITGFVIGSAGLLERLDMGVRLLFGRKLGGYLARWDQLDLSAPEVPRLTCPVEELQKL